jgi:hypothetical protein
MDNCSDIGFIRLNLTQNRWSQVEEKTWRSLAEYPQLCHGVMVQLAFMSLMACYPLLRICPCHSLLSELHHRTTGSEKARSDMLYSLCFNMCLLHTLYAL